MRIDSSGNVGIGTSSPAYRLSVAAADNSGIQILSGNDTHTGFLYFGDTSSNTVGSLSYDHSNNSMRFIVNNTEDMRIDASGNVGIGTNNPASRLSVTGSANIATFDGGSATSISLTGSSRSDLFLIDSGAATDQKRLTIRGDGGNLIFGVENDAVTAFTERMRITSGGDLLVGTTTSYGKTTSASNVGDGYIYASVSISNQANHMVFKNDATTVGSISRNGGSAVSYNTSSDYRLKENIEPMAGALAVVSLLKPVTFKWKIDGTNGQGFIAHELAEVVPDCVAGEKDAVDADGNIKPQGIDTSFLVATLTAAIQELNAKVDAQAAEIALLKSK
jgi:hypothetical protein